MVYEAIGLYSKTAYHIPELSVSVHSFEELCYVMHERLYDLGDFLMRDETIAFIADNLSLHDLADDLKKNNTDLPGFVKVIFSYRHHFTEDTVALAVKSLRDGCDEKEYVRLISRGNFLLENKKYRPALLLFEHAREIMDEEQDKDGLIYRELVKKLGRLYSLYFMFEKAAECFGAAGDAKRAFFCRKLSMSRVDFVDMLLEKHPDEELAREAEEMTKTPEEIAELKRSLEENKSYGRELAIERISARLKAEYRRMML